MTLTIHWRKTLRAPPSALAAARRRKLTSLAPKAVANPAGGPMKPSERHPRPAALLGPRCCTAAAAAPAAQSRNARRRRLAAPLAALPAVSPSHTGGAGDAAVAAAAAAAGPDGALSVTTRLVVPYHPTSHGQQLVLVGGCEALGNWDPKKGVRLTWCEGHSHVAEAELPIHSTIACKLVVLADNGQATWEPDADRELLLAPTSLAGRAAGYTLLCHWGFPACTQLLPNSLRRGGSSARTGAGGGAGAARGGGGGGSRTNGSGGQNRAVDNPILAGVKRALAHSRERLAVIPGVASSWEEEPGPERAEEEVEEAPMVQCQVTVLIPPNGPRLKPEQSLVLVGSGAALGSWEPADGLPLERSGEDSQLWTAQTELPLGEGLQCKVVVVDSVSGRAQVWEPCENRNLARDLGSSRPVLVTAYWGVPTTHCMEVDRLAGGSAASSPQVVQLLRQQLAATSNQLDGLRRERDEARRAIASSEENKRKLDGEAKSLDRGSGRQELVQLAEQLQATRRLYETTKQEALQLGGTMGVTRQLCDAAKRELAGLAAQLEAARTAYAALAPAVERMEQQLATTSRAFEATKPELMALEAQLDRARNMFDRTLQKIEAAKALASGGASDLDVSGLAAAARRRGAGESSTSSSTSSRAREVQYARH